MNKYEITAVCVSVYTAALLCLVALRTVALPKSENTLGTRLYWLNVAAGILHTASAVALAWLAAAETVRTLVRLTMHVADWCMVYRYCGKAPLYSLLRCGQAPQTNRAKPLVVATVNTKLTHSIRFLLGFWQFYLGL